MQRKCAFFLTVIILGCSLNGVTRLVSGNRIVDKNIGQKIGCITAEASETMEESHDSVNSEESEEKNLIEDVEKEKIGESENRIEKDDNEENMQEEISEEESEINCIYNVLFPTNPKAYFDPDNLSGKGQIFSDEFSIENHGNTDIAIKIKNIEVYYRSREEIYELSKESVIDEQSYVKKINVNVIWKNEQEDEKQNLNVAEWDPDEYVLYLKASQYDEGGNYTGLNEGSRGLFYFTGTLNSNPELVWEDGEIMISFDYEIVNIEEKIREQQEEQNKLELKEQDGEEKQSEKKLEEKQEKQNKKELEKEQEEQGEQELEEKQKEQGEQELEEKQEEQGEQELEEEQREK